MEITSTGRSGRIPMGFIEELDNFKATFVYIKMNVAFLKVGSYQTPRFGIGVSLLQTFPDLKSKSLSMFIRINIEQIQPIDVRLRVNPDNDTSDFFPIGIYRRSLKLPWNFIVHNAMR